MNKVLEKALDDWNWDDEQIEFMRNHPDLLRLKNRREQIYEETKGMTDKERRKYFEEAVPNKKYNP